MQDSVDVGEDLIRCHVRTEASAIGVEGFGVDIVLNGGRLGKKRRLRGAEILVSRKITREKAAIAAGEVERRDGVRREHANAVTGNLVRHGYPDRALNTGGEYPRHLVRLVV